MIEFFQKYGPFVKNRGYNNIREGYDWHEVLLDGKTYFVPKDLVRPYFERPVYKEPEKDFVFSLSEDYYE